MYTLHLKRFRIVNGEVVEGLQKLHFNTMDEALAAYVSNPIPGAYLLDERGNRYVPVELDATDPDYVNVIFALENSENDVRSDG